MNKVKYSTLSLAVFACLCVFGCMACSKDDESPTIESIWSNMQNEPIEKVERAYPGQTLCLHGSGLGGLQKIIVNGTEIDVRNNLIYGTDERATFQLPKDVNTSTDTSRYYVKVVTAEGEAVYQPFQVKLLSDKPAISGFSTTVLAAGAQLTIKGSHLEGATAVFLPTAYGNKVSLEFDPQTPNTASAVNVIVPSGVQFAKGQAEVVMQKTDDIMGQRYEERVFSSITNFQ